MHEVFVLIAEIITYAPYEGDQVDWEVIGVYPTLQAGEAAKSHYEINGMTGDDFTKSYYLVGDR
jgi:hypothetical protein